MAKNKSNKGMIFGTVLGAVAGAAYAMWKTPMSGQELRGKLSPGPVNGSSTSSTPATDESVKSAGFTDKVMDVVEHTLAPIVGVDLGKTANNGGPSTTDATGPLNAADAPTDVASPAATDTAMSASGAPIADPAEGEAMMPAGSDSIRMKKFAWGTPAPEAEKQPEAPIQAEENAPVEPVEDATEVPAAEAVKTDSQESASGTTWNSNSIRSQRFAWGDPKPESSDTSVATATETAVQAPIAGNEPAPEQRASNTPAATSHTESGSVADTVMASAASAATGKMVPFPKLGGLENNS